MNRLTLILSVLFFASNSSFSQNDTLRTFTTDSNIIQDKRVNELILKHILINEAMKGKIKGYRVQIHSGAEKSKALEIKTKFALLYNNIPVYLDYQQPYFKVRVGDFRTRLEAYKLLKKIILEFSGSYIVQDQIELPQL